MRGSHTQWPDGGSLVQPAEGSSGGGAGPPVWHGRCPWARGENRSGQIQWMSGCLGLPVGKGGSDPHLGRCEGGAARACPVARRAPCPVAVLLGLVG